MDDPSSFRAFLGSLGEDDPQKADGLGLCGDQFLKAFHITEDYEDVCGAIEAYEQAAACLSEYDPRQGRFLNAIAKGYEARYEKFGLLGDS